MIQKFRILTFSLIVSGALNIGLIATLIVKSVEDKEMDLPKWKVPSSQKVSLGCLELLTKMSELSFSEMAALLTNREEVEEGLTKRDLALAALVSFASFDIERALAFEPLEKREVLLQGKIPVEIFPSLNEAQFEAILRFVYQEKWPLTPKGMFRRLKSNFQEESLKEAFYLTPHFDAVKVLFQKTGGIPPFEVLLRFVLEGSWESLEQFLLSQSQTLDLSVEKKRELLLSYLEMDSSVAAELLLQTDYLYVRQKLDDPMLSKLMALVGSSELSDKLFRDVLASLRAEVVREQAREGLRKRGVVTDEIVATSEVLKPTLSVPERPHQKHQVRKGDTLWGIARTYHVTVKQLLECNDLAKDQIVPGMILYIPSSKKR